MNALKNNDPRAKQAFHVWCDSKGRDGRLQLAALSSYAPVAVFKTNPYVYCPKGDDGRPDCRSDARVLKRRIGTAFTELNFNGTSVFNANVCERTFTVAITNLEYIDQVCENSTYIFIFYFWVRG